MDYQKAIEVIEFYKPRLRQNGLNVLSDAIDVILQNKTKDDAQKKNLTKQF